MMEIDMDTRHWEHGPCPKHDCRKNSCKCGLRLISFPAALGDDTKGSPVAPKNGDYCNALVKYESNGHMYVYSTEGVPERLSSNGTLNFEELLNRPQYDGEVMTGETNIPEVPSAVSQLTNDLNFQTRGEVNSTVTSAVTGEAAIRQQADNNLQSQIDGISASSDVKDIVGTYAELQAYDTSTLGDNDIIKVLQDGTHSDETTYYRWSTATQTFTLIGEEGPYYTKSATDQLLNAKADRATTYTKTETDNLLSDKQNVLTAGANITIVGDVISASGGGGGGTSDYNQLSNKPSINGVTLRGNLTASALGIHEYDDTQIKQDVSTLQSSVSTNTNNIGTLQTGLSTEISNRENADVSLQGQIDAITVSSDVVDIIGTYADLQAYDTSHIKANDIIKVIQDSTHNNAMSYYRWVITNNVGAWSYVGSEGPFYTKSETDTLLNAKANTSDIIVYTAGTGISIQNGVISLSLTSAESESF